MSTPPVPPHRQSLRDTEDIARLRAELDRLAMENATLRAALTDASQPDSEVVRTFVRRRWIGGLASILLLVLAFAFGAWYTRMVRQDAVRGFREGWNATTTLTPPPPPAVAPAAATPSSSAPTPPARPAPRTP